MSSGAKHTQAALRVQHTCKFFTHPGTDCPEQAVCTCDLQNAGFVVSISAVQLPTALGRPMKQWSAASCHAQACTTKVDE